MVRIGSVLLVMVGLLSAGWASAQDTFGGAPQPVSPGPAQPIAAPPPPPPPPGGYAEPATPGSIRDQTVHDRPLALSVLAYVPWFYGIGIGAFTGFEIPIVKDGFIPRLNDQFSLEPSFAFAYSTWRGSALDDDFALLYRVGCSVLWSFFFSSNLRVFANLTLAYTRVDVNSDLRYFRGFGRNYFWPDFSVGVFYNFGARFAVRGELGAHGFRGGIAFLF